MDKSAENRRAHSLFTRWPRVQMRYTAHSLFLRKILTFRNRKQLFNTLNVHNKVLTWQYPADLVLTVLNSTPHSSNQQHTLLQRHACAVVYIGSTPSVSVDLRIAACWRIGLISWLLPSLLHSHRLPRQPIYSSLYSYQLLCTSCFHSTFQASIFCSQQKFIYFCVFTHWVYLVWRSFLPCVRSETSGTSTNKKKRRGGYLKDITKIQ